MSDKPTPGIITKLYALGKTAWEQAKFGADTSRRSMPQLEDDAAALAQSQQTRELAMPEIKKSLSQLTKLIEVVQDLTPEDGMAIRSLQDNLGNLAELDPEDHRHVNAHLATFAMNLPEFIQRDDGLWAYMLEEVDLLYAFEPGLERLKLDRLGLLRDSVNRIYEIKRQVE